MLQDLVWYIRAALRGDSNLQRLALAKALTPELRRDHVSEPANLEDWLREHKDAWESLKPSELDIPAALHEILWPKTDK